VWKIYYLIREIRGSTSYNRVTAGEVPVPSTYLARSAIFTDVIFLNRRGLCLELGIESSCKLKRFSGVVPAGCFPCHVPYIVSSTAC
jgi:hypothetical protein